MKDFIACVGVYVRDRHRERVWVLLGHVVMHADIERAPFKRHRNGQPVVIGGNYTIAPSIPPRTTLKKLLTRPPAKE